MNSNELIGIVGCPLEGEWRRPDENQEIWAKAREEISSAWIVAQYSKHCSLIPDNLWSSAVEME